MSWESAELGELCNFQNGYAFKSSEYSETGKVIIRMSNITREGKLDIDTSRVRYYPENQLSKVSKFLLKKNDIVIAMTDMSKDMGIIGKTAVIDSDDEYLLNQRVGRFTIKDPKKLYFKYLHRYTNTDNFIDYIKMNCAGGLQLNASTKDILRYKIPLPPLPEQKRIAEVLDKADALREKRRLALQKLDTLLQSVFLEMFGDPVKNPKGWNSEKIDDVVLIVSSGSTPLGGNSTYVSTGKTFIRSQNVLMNSFDFSDVAFITDETHKQMKRTWVKKGDVLFNITGASIGRVHYFIGEDDSANVNQHVCIIRPNQKIIQTEFLSYFLSIPSYQANILNKNAGATRQAFNFQQIRGFNIFVPPMSEQNKFVDFYNKVQKLRSNQDKAVNEIENLFQSLQQRAFKGELFNDEFTSTQPQDEKVWQQTSLF
jgi:restriction endonuclease S subunit